MKLEDAFQAGWQDVARSKPTWRNGYHKWPAKLQVEYENGRQAALISRANGVILTRQFHKDVLPAKVIGEINDTREMKHLPGARYARLPFVPKVVSLT